MEKQSENHAGAVDRVEVARETRDRRAEQYEAASGSSNELSAFTSRVPPDADLVLPLDPLEPRFARGEPLLSRL